MWHEEMRENSGGRGRSRVRLDLNASAMMKSTRGWEVEDLSAAAVYSEMICERREESRE